MFDVLLLILNRTFVSSNSVSRFLFVFFFGGGGWGVGGCIMYFIKCYISFI